MIIFLLSVVATIAGVFCEESGHESFNYKLGGDDWGGLCATGKQQSPIDIHFAEQTIFSKEVAIQGCELGAAMGGFNPFYNPNHLVLNRAGQPQATFGFGQTDGVHVTNVGPELVWLFDDDFSTLDIPVEGHDLAGILHDNNKVLDLPALLLGGDVQNVKAEFVNFHLHSPSEHMYNGFLAPLEGHFVMKIPRADLGTCPDAGCLSVVSVHFMHDADDTPNPFIQQTLEMMDEGWPMEIGKTQKVNGTLDFDELLPRNPRYMLYDGSLTTPPCTEGVLWHVIQESLVVSKAQVAAIQDSIAAVHNGTSRNNRRIQNINGRDLIYHNCV